MPYKKFEEYNIEVTDDIKDRYQGIIESIGEDVDRDGLLKTPERASKAIQYLTSGYQMDAEKVLKSALFEESYSEMVIIKDIELYSLCEHHILPFFGKAHIAYIPNGRIVGLSKIPRVVDIFRQKIAGSRTPNRSDCVNIR